MPTPNEAARNIGDAVDLARAGKLGAAFRLLRQGREQPPPGVTASGDDSGVTGPGDDASYPDPGYPSVDLPGYDPYYPYEPPIGQEPVSPTDDPFPAPPPPPPPAGWYRDPFDGVGLRWWNGYGWTELSQG